MELFHCEEVGFLSHPTYKQLKHPYYHSYSIQIPFDMHLLAVMNYLFRYLLLSLFIDEQYYKNINYT